MLHKYVLFTVIAIGTTYSSSSFAASSNAQDPKRKILKIKSRIPVSEGSGESVPVDLLQEDYFSNKTFKDQILCDHKRSLPSMLALITHRLEDGRTARCCADGRYYHDFLRLRALGQESFECPLYKGELIGSPEYFAMQIKDRKLHTKFVGTEQDTGKADPKGRLLSGLLSLEQTPEVWIKIGTAYNDLGETSGYIEWVEKAVSALQQEDKPCGYILQEIGLTQVRAKNWDTAVELLERAASALQREGEPYGNLLRDIGFIYLEKEDRDKADGWFERAISVLQGEDKPCLNILEVLDEINRIYFEKEDWDRYIEWLKRAVPILQREGKICGHILSAIGTTYFFRKEDCDNGLAWYEPAVQILQQEGRPYSHVLCEMSLIYFKKEDWDKGLASIEMAAQVSQQEGAAYGHIVKDIGLLHGVNQDWDNALERFEQAVQILQREGRPYGHVLPAIGCIYYYREDLDNALEQFERAARVSLIEGRSYGHVLQMIGAIYLKKGNWDKALEWFEQAIEVSQREGVSCVCVLPVIGSVYSEKKDWDNAIKFFKQALKQLQHENQNCSDILSEIGHAYMQKQNWDKAEKYLKKSLLAGNETPIKALRLLGYIYYEIKNDTVTACDYYRQCLLLQKEDTVALISILYIYATSRDQSSLISESEIQEYAKRLLLIPSDDDILIAYRTENPRRYARALQEAEQLVSGSSGYEFIHLPTADLFTHGCSHEDRNNIMRACVYYRLALQCSIPEFLACSLIHMLNLYATYPDQCSSVPEQEMREYAQRLLQIPSDDNFFVHYRERDPERYARALQEAERLVNGSGGSENSAPAASSSCDANTLD